MRSGTSEGLTTLLAKIRLGASIEELLSIATQCLNRRTYQIICNLLHLLISTEARLPGSSWQAGSKVGFLDPLNTR